MLCCAGLFAGVLAAAYLGVPWAPYVTIPLGTAGGLLGDIAIFGMIGKKKRGSEAEEEQQEKETDMNLMCCASIFNLRKKKKQQMETAVASEN